LIYIFRKQFHMTTTQEKGCRDTCIFIIYIYIDRFFRSHVAVEAPYQVILFLQCFIKYKKVDKQISKSALKNVVATYGI